MRTGLSFFIITTFFLVSACTDPIILPLPSEKNECVIYGQVYNLSHPGPIPVGWIPPPYEYVCTVIAEDVQQNIRIETATDSKGKFQFRVPPGVYFLRIKESWISSVSGPYSIKGGERVEAKAYFDNGMR